ncbi:hypothetical protein WJX81_003901 [Elliptochloris bilobata]|uniref:SPX domain-containing protein n=1 Tax=Elliptochloris bilobata TaxID=381761 RepID=A0AAW1S915_9CHLO
MKFGKLLGKSQQTCAEEMGNLGIGEHFLRYKKLKKQLKEMQALDTARGDNGEAAAPLDEVNGASGQGGGAAVQLSGGKAAGVTPAEAHFVEMLREDLESFNDFFIGKEEDYVIRMEALASQQAVLGGNAERQAALRSLLIDLHGEMVLLLHWSMLNYAAVVKILKKHDKHSSVLLRTRFLANVLKQPFYSTEHVTELVRSAEQRIEELRQDQDAASAATAGEDATAAKVESLRKSEALLFRRTQAALEMWQEMADKASTPSTVLLPPAKRAKTGEPAAGAAAAAPHAVVADAAVAQGAAAAPSAAAAAAEAAQGAGAAPTAEAADTAAAQDAPPAQGVAA